MITIGNTKITNMHVGDNVPTGVFVDSTKVWPVDYFYTLTFSASTYSSASNQIHATGNDYCEFKCSYKQYRASDSGLVSDTLVIATPSATYFKSTSNKLYYDYNTYKATAVSSGYKNVTLTYSGISITSTFSFAGNSYTESSTITPVVITGKGSTSSNPVYASGATLTYTGGVVSNYRNWSSGYNELVSTQNAAFNNAYNSKSSSFVGVVVPSNNTINIPSLATLTLDAGYYNFTSYSYNGVSTSFNAYQESNYATSITDSFDFYDAANNIIISGNYDIASSAGTMSFYVKRTHTVAYRSGAEQTGTAKVANNAMNVSYQTVTGTGIITSTGTSGTYNVVVNYSQNTTQSQKVDIVIASNIDGTSYYFSLRQAAGGASVYVLSTSVSSLTIGSSAGTVQFSIVSTKDGSPYVPSVSINPNNIGGSIVLGGSGPYTATLSYTDNLNTESTRTATILVEQTARGGLSKSISVTQVAAGDDPFYGINIVGTSGNWRIGTIKVGETTIPGQGTFDVVALVVLKNSPITADAAVSIDSISVTQWRTTTTYTNVSQTVSANSTLTLTPYGGSSHTYYGTYLRIEDYSYTPFPGGDIKMLSGFSVS